MTIMETQPVTTGSEHSPKAVFGYEKGVLTQRREWLDQLHRHDPKCSMAIEIREKLADLVDEFVDRGLMTPDGQLTSRALTMGLEL